MNDKRVCPVCRELDGYTWTIEVGESTAINELTHPAYGVVCDRARGSRAHEHGSYGECRCQLSFDVDISDINKRLDEILAELKGAAT